MNQHSGWDSFFQRRDKLLIFLCCAFLFRLAFGLCSEFWYEDELQIYLLGLKFYSLPLSSGIIIYSVKDDPAHDTDQ